MLRHSASSTRYIAVRGPLRHQKPGFDVEPATGFEHRTCQCQPSAQHTSQSRRRPSSFARVTKRNTALGKTMRTSHPRYTGLRTRHTEPASSGRHPLPPSAGEQRPGLFPGCAANHHVHVPHIQQGQLSQSGVVPPLRSPREYYASPGHASAYLGRHPLSVKRETVPPTSIAEDSDAS